MPVLDRGKEITWEGHCVTCGYRYGGEKGPGGFDRVEKAIHEHCDEAGLGHYVAGPYDAHAPHPYEEKEEEKCAYCDGGEEKCEHCGAPK